MYYVGQGTVFDQLDNFVLIVGSTKASAYEIGAAFALGKKMAERGLVVVSGLAKGVDTAAHEGALAQGGKTVAILANTPFEKTYPSDNEELATRICESGALLYPFSTPQNREVYFGLNHFQRRLIERDYLQAMISKRAFVACDTEPIKGGTRHAMGFAQRLKLPTHRIDSQLKFHAEPRIAAGGIGWDSEINLHDREFIPWDKD